jgi:hypothetical protein
MLSRHAVLACCTAHVAWHAAFLQNVLMNLGARTASLFVYQQCLHASPSQ